MILEMVEGAIQTIADTIEAEINGELERVYAHYQQLDPVYTLIDLPRVNPGSVYVSELVEPILCPAIFLTAPESELNLQVREPFVQVHRMLCTALVEGLDAQVLTRKTWRYALALYNVLTEGGPQAARNMRRLRSRSGGQVIVQVNAFDYSPVYTRMSATGARQFRKDATLRLLVKHDE